MRRWRSSTMRTERHVIGLLTEAHVLRRYTDELDKANRELSGDWSDAS